MAEPISIRTMRFRSGLADSSDASLELRTITASRRNADEPAVIARFDIAPVGLELSDPVKPAWREV